MHRSDGPHVQQCCQLMLPAHDADRRHLSTRRALPPPPQRLPAALGVGSLFLYRMGTCVAPRPASAVRLSAMGASQASFSICLSSEMRGKRGLAPVHCGRQGGMGARSQVVGEQGRHQTAWAPAQRPSAALHPAGPQNLCGHFCTAWYHHSYCIMYRCT